MKPVYRVLLISFLCLLLTLFEFLRSLLSRNASPVIPSPTGA